MTVNVCFDKLRFKGQHARSKLLVDFLHFNDKKKVKIIHIQYNKSIVKYRLNTVVLIRT